MEITNRNPDEPNHLDVFLNDPRLSGLVGSGAPFEIQDVTVDGIPMRDFVRAPKTILDCFAMGKAHESLVKVKYLDESWTYGQVRGQALSVARELRDRFGVKQGDRVAIVMRNYPEFYVEFWAIAVLGAIIVPLNSWGTGRELTSTLQDCGAVVAFTDQQRLKSLESHFEELPGVQFIAVRTEKEVWNGTHLSDLVSGEQLPESEFAQLGQDDPVTILYTSGTTGKPKGALGTNRSTIANLMNMSFGAAREFIISGRKPPEGRGQSVGISGTPLFHIGGVGGAVGAQMGGSKNVLMYKWDAEEFLRLAEAEGATSMPGIPALTREVLDHPNFSKYKLNPISSPLGGAAVPPDLPRRLLEIYGDELQIMNGYGLTETTAAACSNFGSEYAAHLDSVGRPNLTADIRIVDPNGKSVPHGQIGELTFRTPQNVKCYWNNPKATAESFIDGWFHSGDLGYVTDEGFVYVVDRLKDMVDRGGENVYCAEVEAALHENPDIADVAVIGLPDSDLGERVCAVIIPQAGATITLESVRAFASERIAKYKCPEALYIVQEIPRTATGKQLKSELRKIVADDSARIEWL